MKLVLLGTADTMVQAPYDDRTWEIWACQTAITYPACKRADAIFELHDDSYWSDPAIIERINAWGGPVWMQRQVPQIPKSQALPLDEMIASFGDAVGARYYTSTIALMLAFALYRGEYDEIALWGVHMETAEEWGKQRSAMEYWVGVANGRGVKVHVPRESSLCRSATVYGYDSESALMSEVRRLKDKMGAGLVNIKGELDNVVQKFHEQNGAIRALDYISRKFS